MGGSYGPQVLYAVANLSQGKAWKMAMHRLKSRSVPLGTDPHFPTIAVDCNNVIHKVGRSNRDPVAATACFLKEWADYGFVVIPVGDGETPHAKQATVKQIAGREKNSLKSIVLRRELRKLSKKLDEGTLNVNERKATKTKIDQLSKAI